MARKKKDTTSHMVAAAPGTGVSMAGEPVPYFAEGVMDARFYVGDCREILPRLAEVKRSMVDLVFADPPFNWNRAYDKWDDAMPREDYLKFTADWLDLCIKALKPTGSMWVNIPDDTAAEIVMHLKNRGMSMVNWCVWHYRFGQNCTEKFIGSKVHALYFSKDPFKRTWNPMAVLEQSDRAAIYGDPRTQSKRDGMPPGMRLPMDVWYGKYWGRIQGNNFERRENHDNQLPEVYLERVILSSSNEGDLVLDPFLGSGTTAVVARALKRRFIGTEFSKDNARSCVERMKIGTKRVGLSQGQSTAIFEARPSLKRKKNGSTAGSDSAADAMVGVAATVATVNGDE